MDDDWKKNFIYYSVLALLALSTVVIVLKVNVKLATAQGGCAVVVTGDGATCDNGGSNPGGGGTDGGSTPGNSNPGTENPGSGGGDDRFGQGGAGGNGMIKDRIKEVLLSAEELVMKNIAG